MNQLICYCYKYTKADIIKDYLDYDTDHKQRNNTYDPNLLATIGAQGLSVTFDTLKNQLSVDDKTSMKQELLPMLNQPESIEDLIAALCKIDPSTCPAPRVTGLPRLRNTDKLWQTWIPDYLYVNGDIGGGYFSGDKIYQFKQSDQGLILGGGGSLMWDKNVRLPGVEKSRFSTFGTAKINYKQTSTTGLEPDNKFFSYGSDFLFRNIDREGKVKPYTTWESDRLWKYFAKGALKALSLLPVPWLGFGDEETRWIIDVKNYEYDYPTKGNPSAENKNPYTLQFDRDREYFRGYPWFIGAEADKRSPIYSFLDDSIKLDARFNAYGEYLKAGTLKEEERENSIKTGDFKFGGIVGIEKPINLEVEGGVIVGGMQFKGTNSVTIFGAEEPVVMPTSIMYRKDGGYGKGSWSITQDHELSLYGDCIKWTEGGQISCITRH